MQLNCEERLLSKIDNKKRNNISLVSDCGFCFGESVNVQGVASDFGNFEARGKQYSQKLVWI